MTVDSLSLGRKPKRWWALWKRGPKPVGQLRWERSLRGLSIVVILAFVGLGIRLGMLQLVQNPEMPSPVSGSASELSTVIVEHRQPAARGKIEDIHGNVLAYNVPVHRLFVQPKSFKEKEKAKITWARLRSHLSWEESKWALVEKKWQQAFERNVEEAEIARLQAEEWLVLAVDKQNMPGIRLETASERAYWTGPQQNSSQKNRPLGKNSLQDLYYCGKNHSEACLWAHVVGFVNQSSQEEVAAQQHLSGELVGRVGIERLFDSILRGQFGVDKTIRENGKTKQVHEDPVAGQNVVLTLDLHVQRLLQQALRMYPQYPAKAAAVVEVQTGRVLGMLSVPAVDPNMRFSEEIQAQIWKDPASPTKDKVLREAYYPASTIKPITALAAWQRAKQGRFQYNPHEHVKCNGEYIYRGLHLRCTGAHGMVDLHEALKRSCNVYFFRLAERLGLDAIAETAAQLGLGQAMNLKMGEVQGLMPTEKYYQERNGFQPGYALNSAIGQGDVKFTVLQIAEAYAALFNGGFLYKPGFIDHIETSTHQIVEKYQPTIVGQPFIPAGYEELVLSALRDAVQKPKGTAFEPIRKEFPQQNLPDVAGKTGTAQIKERKRNRKGGPLSDDSPRNNAWFVGLFPSHHPRVVIVVLVPGGGKGGEVAAPIGMSFFKGYAERLDSTDHSAP